MLSRQQRTRASTKKSSRRSWQLLALLRIEKSLHIRTRREGVRMQRPGQLVQELYRKDTNCIPDPHYTLWQGKATHELGSSCRFGEQVSLLKPKFAASTRRPIWFCLVLGIAILQRNNLTACESWRARRRERYCRCAPFDTGMVNTGSSLLLAVIHLLALSPSQPSRSCARSTRVAGETWQVFWGGSG